MPTNYIEEDVSKRTQLDLYRSTQENFNRYQKLHQPRFSYALAPNRVSFRPKWRNLKLSFKHPTESDHLLIADPFPPILRHSDRRPFAPGDDEDEEPPLEFRQPYRYAKFPEGTQEDSPG